MRYGRNAMRYECNKIQGFRILLFSLNSLRAPLFPMLLLLLPLIYSSSLISSLLFSLPDFFHQFSFLPCQFCQWLLLSHIDFLHRFSLSLVDLSLYGLPSLPPSQEGPFPLPPILLSQAAPFIASPLTGNTRLSCLLCSRIPRSISSFHFLVAD